VSSRERAQSLILAGKVRIGDEPADKPGRMVAEDTDVSVAEDPNPYVSRGGLKLAQALQEFHVDPTGKMAVDIGASTGGFTDCLLQKGVAKVFAVDVGYGQLDWKLQSDERVVMIDRTNARQLSLDEVGGEPLDLAVIDVAFISLKLILPAVFQILKPGGQWIALVKPQFEVGKDEVENQGIITDLNKHLKVLLELKQFIEASDWCLAQVCRSPIKGQKGNQEYLIHGKQQNTKSSVDETLIRETVGL
jgi:23S rRNA (cytidine1920-2'-O)/16S rRNA (cytidine1409-2'-O)-methyltransferase